MNKQDYIQEGLRQLSDSNHHEILEEDPIQNYNNQIYQVLQQAPNLNIMDDKMKKILYNKAPRTPNFYMLPKIHKPNNPERLIMNGIGSITEETNTGPMKKLLMCRLANLVLTKNYFSFNKRLYRQIQGTAMETRMAPSHANIFIKYVETQLIDTSPRNLKYGSDSLMTFS